MVNLYCMLIVGLGIFMLESFITNINVINTISSFALIIVIVTIVTVVIRVIQTLTSGKLPYSDDWIPPDPAVPIKPTLEAALIDLPSFFGLYSLQSLIPPYYNEMTIPFDERKGLIVKATNITVIVVGILYYIISVTGPLIFNGVNQPEKYQKDNILNNFDSSDSLMSVVRIL